MKERGALDSGRRRGSAFYFAAFVVLMVVTYVRPQDLLPGLGVVPVAGFYTYSFLLLMLLNLYRWPLREPAFLWMFAFTCYCGASILWAININGPFTHTRDIFVTGVIFTVGLWVACDDMRRWRLLLGVLQVVIVLTAMITLLRGGYGTGAFIKDPNDAALFLSMGIPLSYVIFRFPAATSITRPTAMACMLTEVAGVISTGSRGGFLALLTALGCVWLLEPKKGRLLAMGFVLVIAGLMTRHAWLPEGYISEMESITDEQDSTRIERFQIWETAWLMYLDNPILGVGAGNFPWNASVYEHHTSWWREGEVRSLASRVTHSLYFELLADLGTVGVVLFLGMIRSIVNNCRTALRSAGSESSTVNDVQRAWANWCLCALGVYLVGGAFLSVLYYPYPYFIIGVSIIVARFRDCPTDLPEEPVASEPSPRPART